MPIDTSADDPISEPEPARKKPRRLWLFAPYVILALLLAGYGGYWILARQRLGAEIDARAEALRNAGYTVSLGERQVGGFPFRMKLTFPEARIASPSGWAIAAPGLAAEAYLHDLGHWVLVAPQGLTVVRPEGGGIEVRGESLRASIAGVRANPWRIVLAGTKLTFTPAPGARPFSLASAERIELYLRPSPTAGEGMTLFRLEGGKATAGTVLHRVAGDAVVTANLQARLTKPEAFRGRDWGAAVRAWAAAGGEATGVEGGGSGGQASVRARGGELGVGADGRLVGAVPLELRQAGAALTALAEGEALDPDAAGTAAAVAAARAQGEAANINLVFQAGVMTLGPVRIGRAPRVG